MKVVVLYVGSSLLGPLKQAEREIHLEHDLGLTISAYNFGAPFNDDEWGGIEGDLRTSEIVFAIHVMDGENATRLIRALDRYKQTHAAVIVINCMPDLMRRTRMGKLDTSRLNAFKAKDDSTSTRKGTALISAVSSWVGRQARSRKSSGNGNGGNGNKGHGQYLKFMDRLPSLLRFIPNAGKLRDVKNYLNIFCYFLQPTPANVRWMILCALKEYVADERLETVGLAPPERMPSIAIYHPDAPKMFETFDEYRTWYASSPKSKIQSPPSATQGRTIFGELNPETTIGLLLMRPQVISKTTKHYDSLIRAIEAEGLSVIPALSTLMDNREAVRKFFVGGRRGSSPTVREGASAAKVQHSNSTVGRRGSSPTVRDGSSDCSVQHSNSKVGCRGSSPTVREGASEPRVQRPESNVTNERPKTEDQRPKTEDPLANSRVSQIVSLTGFSFVGGPAMNDSDAAAEFLQNLNRPYRSAISLDTQTIDAWKDSQTGLNPVQAGMQIAIPEIDGATEPFIYGGLPARGVEPVALDERCTRFARRLKRWNRLRTAPRSELKLALILFCFPPNKGNIGTAADLDVFPSVWDMLLKLQQDGYKVELPESPEALRKMLIEGNTAAFATTANVAYRMPVGEYERLCPYVEEVEKDWGPAPGKVNTFGNELLIQGVQLGNVFIGLQPTFGYEGDPMRMMLSRSGAPHHGFMAFHTYLAQVLNVDAAIHVGTHGALEFMPGKQVGLSEECWPDRLVGELPNIYIYSVNNPSEGSIAKRRSYAELISYLTPPIENAGLYRDLSTLKDLVMSFRQSGAEAERASLYESIEEYSAKLNLKPNFPNARTHA